MTDRCRCQDCDPDLHDLCSADCLIYDCSSSWACCNRDCDGRAGQLSR